MGSETRLISEDFDYLVLEKFPSPLAVTYQRLIEANLWSDKVYRALELFDYGIRTLVLCSLSRYVEVDVPLGRTNGELDTALSNFSQPSLGRLLEILRFTLEAYQGRREEFPIPELYDLYFDPELGPEFNKACACIIEIRNDLSHRFRPIDEKGWRELFDRLFLNVRWLLEHFSFFENYTIIDVSQISADVVQCVAYVSARPKSKILHLPPNVTLETDRVYLHSHVPGREQFIALHPLMISWPPGIQSFDTALYESTTSVRVRYLAAAIREVVEALDEETLNHVQRILLEGRERARGARGVIHKLNWGLIRQSARDITEISTETIRQKYDQRVYLQRMSAKAAVDDFLASDSVAFVLLGKSGVGKSNFLLSLVDEYSEREDTAILMMDAGRISGRDSLERALIQAIRSTVQLGRKMVNKLDQDFWNELDNVREIHRKKLVLIFDAINENPAPGALLRQIDLVAGGKRRPWLKIIMSSRPQAWKAMQIGLPPLAESRYYRQPNRLEAGVELEGFSLTEVGGELKRFTGGELPVVYAKYRNVYNLQTSFEALRPSLVRELRDPLTLKLVAGIYKGEAIPDDIDMTQLYSQYISRLIRDKRLTEKDIFFLEECMMPLMLGRNHYLNKITADQIAGTRLEDGRLLRELILDSTKLTDGRKINESFTNLVDAEILTKQGDPLDFVIRFKYERFYDYFTGRRFRMLFQGDSERSSKYIDLAKEVRKSPYLWGGVFTLLISEVREDDSDLVLSLAQSEDHLLRDMISSALVQLGRAQEYESMIYSYLDRLIAVSETSQVSSYKIWSRLFGRAHPSSRGAALSQIVAVRVAGELGVLPIIESALVNSSEAIRFAGIRAAYHLWRNNSEQGLDLLERISLQTRTRWGTPNFRTTMACIAITGLILTETRSIDLSQPETLELYRRMQQIWRNIIDRILYVSKDGLLNETVRRRLRMLLLRILVDVVLRFVEEVDVDAFPVRSELRLFFDARRETKERLTQILTLLDADHITQEKLATMRDDLIQAAQEGDTVIASAIFLILLSHGRGQIDEILPIADEMVRSATGNTGIFDTQVLFALDLLLTREQNIQSTWHERYEDLFRFVCTKSSGYQTYRSNGKRRFGLSLDRYCVIRARSDVDEPHLIVELFEEAVQDKNEALLLNLIKRMDLLGITFRLPKVALYLSQALTVPFTREQKSPELAGVLLSAQVVSAYMTFLARLRRYFPDEVDAFLIDHDVPEHTLRRIQSLDVAENLLGELLGYNLGIIAVDAVQIPAVRAELHDILNSCLTARNATEWLSGAAERLVNFVYGEPLF